jgi:hypothetical protein
LNLKISAPFGLIVLLCFDPTSGKGPQNDATPIGAARQSKPILSPDRLLLRNDPSAGFELKSGKSLHEGWVLCLTVIT